jgi:hypothetical protein
MSDKLFSEEWAVVGVVDPDANGTGELLTGAIDMADWEQLAVVSMCGTLGASASVVVAVTASATSGGTYAAVSGKTVTHGGDSPTTGSDEQKIINVRSEEITSNKRYVKISHTVAGATTDSGVVVLGKARHLPAYDRDAASVTEIVN